MPKFKFSASDIVVEASSEEEALSKIGARIGAIGRHLGNGVKISATKPFFNLARAADGAKLTDMSDPIAEANREAAAVDKLAGKK